MRGDGCRFVCSLGTVGGTVGVKGSLAEGKEARRQDQTATVWRWVSDKVADGEIGGSKTLYTAVMERKSVGMRAEMVWMGTGGGG